MRVKDEMARLDRLHAEQSAAAQEPIHPSTSNPPTVPIRGGKTSQSGIIVEGIDNCLVKFAKCCTPVPGDPVVGFITRGFGVSVHRADCPNASDAKRAEEPGRWIRVDWATGELVTGLLRLAVADLGTAPELAGRRFPGDPVEILTGELLGE